MLLQDKTIIVLGAAGLLGQEIVRSIHKQGGNVIAADINEKRIDEILHDAPKEATQSARVDTTDSESISSLFTEGSKRWTKIDGAVNSSYPRTPSYGKPVMQVTYEDFCGNVSVHLGGYFLFTKHCAMYAMSTMENFSLINISSIYGNIAPRFDLYNDTNMTSPVEYSATKSAIHALTKYFGAFTKGSKFRVNTVSPGGIAANQPETFLRRYKNYCRFKGMLSPRDITGSIVYLLSDYSEFVISQNITIDDGFSL